MKPYMKGIETNDPELQALCDRLQEAIHAEPADPSQLLMALLTHAYALVFSIELRKHDGDKDVAEFNSIAVLKYYMDGITGEGNHDKKD